MASKIRLLSATASVVVLLLVVSFPSVLHARTWGASGLPQKLHLETFRSPAFRLSPGDVINEEFRVGMPKGHIAIKGLEAQVVRADGTPVPLSETYLHHWILLKYLFSNESNGSRPVAVPNAGPCQVQGGLPQWFGLGSETRRTNTAIPEPYGIVTGDPTAVPPGFEEIWVLNLHAIDTRGTVDPRRCTECLCRLFNVTTYDDGEPLPLSYKGGLECCEDHYHCAQRSGFYGDQTESIMEFTVSWVDMAPEVVPVDIYILDVTDTRASVEESPGCKVEYTVPKCAEGSSNEECVHTAESVSFLGGGGDVVYAVAHQHSGGVGSSLYNEDGTLICWSTPIYGDGNEAGNEAGYIVGMTNCYPEPGTVQVRAGEKLQHKSFYNNTQEHTGVMGLFYLLVAPPAPPSSQANMTFICGAVSVIAAAALVLIGIRTYKRYRVTKRTSEAGYHSVSLSESGDH